jgi:hypothetical protein
MHGKIIVLLFLHVLSIISYGWFVRNPFIVPRHHSIVATLWAEQERSDQQSEVYLFDDKISYFLNGHSY